MPSPRYRSHAEVIVVSARDHVGDEQPSSGPEGAPGRETSSSDGLEVDPASVAALGHLRSIVAGTADRGSGPTALAPNWVSLEDRARARWLQVPVALRLGVAVLGALGALSAGWWLLRPPPVPAELALPTVTTGFAAGAPTDLSADRAASAAADTAAQVEAADLVVHAAGAVARPGVVRLPAGSRIGDLIAAAGGASPDANLDRINLAAPLVDGAQVYVPRLGEDAAPVQVQPALPAPPTPLDGASPSARIDLNAADVALLETLPGIGPATATAIVEHRARSGPFRSVEDLLDVRGIGPAKLEAIADLVMVSG